MASHLAQYGGHGNIANNSMWVKQTPSSRDTPNYQAVKREEIDLRPVSVTSHTSSETEDSQNRDSWTTVLLPSSPSSLAGKPYKTEQVTIDLTSLPDLSSERARYRTLEENQKQIFHQRFPSAPYTKIQPRTKHSCCVTLCSSIFFFFGAVLLFVPFAVVLIVLFPVCVIMKKIIACCCSCCHKSHCCTCCCAQHLTHHERTWLRSSSFNSAVMQCLLVVKNGLDSATIKDLIYTRLILSERKRGHALFPRLTQKVIPFCTGYAWVYDEDFLIDNHVYTVHDFISTEEALQDYISDMASKQFNMKRPLWEVQIMHNFGEGKDSLILFRMHPCMSDGASLVHLILKELVDNQLNMSSKPSLNRTRICFNLIYGFLFGPLMFLQKWLCFKQDFNLLHGNHIHLSGRKIAVWSQPVSLSVAMRVKQIARCTLNDLFVSLVGGSLRTYLQMNGISNPFNMQCIIPVSLRVHTKSKEIENRYIFVSTDIPTNTEGAIPRLWDVKCSMAKLKKSPQSIVMNAAMWMTYNMMPESWCDKLWSGIFNHCTCLISNMAGPENLLLLDTKEIKSIIYWMPTPDQVPVSVSFFTYAEKIQMSVIADRSVLPNPELLTKDFNYQLRKLSQLVAHRSVPGEQLSQRLESMRSGNESSGEMAVQQIQVKMALVQTELYELKLRLEARTGRKISEKDMRLIRKIEQLKEEMRELLVELRKKKSEEEHSLILTNNEIEDDILETDLPRPQRRRALSISSKRSTVSVSSVARPLAASPTIPELQWPAL